MEISYLFNVTGKVVLVTGGAKGIGFMISSGFVRNGARVYISSRDAAACKKAVAELNVIGPGCAIAIPAELQSLEACNRLAADLAAREPQLHVLVHNSGATWGDTIESFPDATWTKLLTLNVQRVFTLTQLLLPQLEAAASTREDAIDDPARIILIGSIDGLRVPAMNNFAYSASKAGAHHLASHLALVLGPKAITCNTIACGPFPSKMMKHFLDTIGMRFAKPTRYPASARRKILPALAYIYLAMLGHGAMERPSG